MYTTKFLLIGSTFGRDTEISNPEYAKAQVALEDIQYHQKLLHYVVSGQNLSICLVHTQLLFAVHCRTLEL